MPHNFVHLEIVHPDPDAAGQYMIDVFGAERVERQVAAQIEAIVPGIKLVHVKMGNCVFQFVKPNEALAHWKKQLDTWGPSIHNVSLTIENVDTVAAEIERSGGTVLMAQDVDLQASLGYEGDPLFKTYVIDANAQIGLSFELFDERSAWIGGATP